MFLVEEESKPFPCLNDDVIYWNKLKPVINSLNPGFVLAGVSIGSNVSPLQDFKFDLYFELLLVALTLQSSHGFLLFSQRLWFRWGVDFIYCFITWLLCKPLRLQLWWRAVQINLAWHGLSWTLVLADRQKSILRIPVSADDRLWGFWLLWSEIFPFFQDLVSGVANSLLGLSTAKWKYLNNCWIDCHENWSRHSWSTEDDTKWKW